MNGFIKAKGLLAGLCGLTLAALSGCYGYHDLVDPCYPTRYEVSSKRIMIEDFAPQVNNGHVLDQTIWNFYFDPGTDRLNAAGLEKLSFLARRRPAPDCTVYLQTAEDVVYDPANPNKMVETRLDLDNKRRDAVEKFLTAETTGRGLTFNIVVHDPADAGFSADPLGRAAAAMHGRFTGGGAAGGGAAGGGAAAGGASAGGAPR
jgi:hypothetical protein